MKSFYEAIGILNKNKKEKEQISILLEIPFEMLEYYNNNHILPDSGVLNRIEQKIGISKFDIMLKMGIYTQKLKECLSNKSSILSLDNNIDLINNTNVELAFKTN